MPDSHAMSLVDALIQGLTAPVSEAQRAAYAGPPYPTPPALVAPRASVLGELEARLPANGDGPMTVTRVLGPVQPYRLEVRSAAPARPVPVRRRRLRAARRRRPHRRRRRDAPAPPAALLRHRPPAGAEPARRRRRHRCPRGRRPDRGRHRLEGPPRHRRRPRRPGRRRRVLRRLEALCTGEGPPRPGDLKRRLVEGVARATGWEAALTLTADKRLGPAFARHAFTAFGADVDGLRRVLAGVGALPELDQLALLAEAVRQAAGKDPASDHPYLPELVDRIIAVDPATDRATMRSRDWLLFSLWPAMGEQATLERARRAIRTPQYKRELHRLPRDVTASLRHRPAS
ncbi:hypothetical protein GCM10020218_026850 [Dactylosporangium vinaceum]